MADEMTESELREYLAFVDGPESLRHCNVIMDEEFEDYLAHYGVPGQKWGRRRYQNEDGSLTAEGKEHYGVQNLSPVNRDFHDAEGNKLAVEERDKLYSVVNKAEKRDKRILKQETRQYRAAKNENSAVRYHDEEQKKITESADAAKRFIDQYLNAKYGDYGFANLKDEVEEAEKAAEERKRILKEKEAERKQQLKYQKEEDERQARIRKAEAALRSKELEQKLATEKDRAAAEKKAQAQMLAMQKEEAKADKFWNTVSGIGTLILVGGTVLAGLKAKKVATGGGGSP